MRRLICSIILLVISVCGFAQGIEGIWSNVQKEKQGTITAMMVFNPDGTMNLQSTMEFTQENSSEILLAFRIDLKGTWEKHESSLIQQLDAETLEITILRIPEGISEKTADRIRRSSAASMKKSIRKEFKEPQTSHIDLLSDTQLIISEDGPDGDKTIYTRVQ